MRRVFLISLLALAGCGGGGHSRDHGAPSDVYPAPHTPIGQLQDGGGTVLASPRITAITFPGDPYAPMIDDFTAAIGATSYWTQTTEQYGVGPAVATTAVHYSQAAPPSTSTPAMESWLASMLDGTHPEFPPPVQDASIYVVYYPEGTVVDDGQIGGVSCQDYLAFHSYIQVAGKQVAYALVPRCHGYLDISDLDNVTDSASHELIEAATDPYAISAWFGMDVDGGALDLLSGGGEDADLCQYEPHNNYVFGAFPYVVQRSWSNASAAAGHDPCAPQVGAYFNAAPVLPDAITVNDGFFDVPMRGVKLKPGQSKTIELDLFSDGPVGDWSVGTFDNALYYGLPQEIEGTLDRESGTNGEKLYLTLHVLRAGQVYPNAEVLYVLSQKDGALHDWPIVVYSR